MPKYKIDLVAKLVGFQEITVEADSEIEARQMAREEGQLLAEDIINWDIQYVDYHNVAGRDRPRAVYDVEVNECKKI